MPVTRITGYDGNFTGFAISSSDATLAHNLVCNAWSMTIGRVISDVTGYGDTARRKLGGIPEYTGSASGFMKFDAADTSPALSPANINDPVGDGSQRNVYATLQAATGCTYAGDCVLSNIALSSTKTGDATISFDFAFDGAPTQTWDSAG